MKTLLWSLCVALVTIVLTAENCSAITPFKKAFDEKYVKKTKDKEFKRAFRKAGCNTCHVKGEKRDVNNPYGKELAKLIEGNAEKRIKDAGDDGKKAETEKVLAELEIAFKKVEKLKSPSGELFGERLKAFQLPVPLSAQIAKDKDDEDEEGKDDDEGDDDVDDDVDDDDDAKEGGQ